MVLLLIVEEHTLVIQAYIKKVKMDRAKMRTRLIPNKGNEN